MVDFQGYYSLAQYSEYPERAEFVNIGVIVFAGVSPYVWLKFSKNQRRIVKAFGVQLGQHYSRLCESLESRLRIEFREGWSTDKLERFIAMRTGKVRLSAAHSLCVKDPSDALSHLFDKLVGEPPQVSRRERAVTKLSREFRLRDVERLLERPKPVQLDGGVKITARYGYQNGSYNLIDAISLQGDPDSALGKASPLMIEGEMLFEQTRTAERKQLVLVGDVEGQEEDFVSMLSDRMNRHSVGFYPMNGIEPLVADIRKNVAGRHPSS